MKESIIQGWLASSKQRGGGGGGTLGLEKNEKVKFITNHVGVCFLAFAIPVPSAGLCSHATPSCYTASPWQSLGFSSGLLISGQACQPPHQYLHLHPALCVCISIVRLSSGMYIFFVFLDWKVSWGMAVPVCGICCDIPLVLEWFLSQGKHSLSLPGDEYRNEWRKERSFLHLKVLLESKRK